MNEIITTDTPIIDIPAGQSPTIIPTDEGTLPPAIAIQTPEVIGVEDETTIVA